MPLSNVDYEIPPASPADEPVVNAVEPLVPEAAVAAVAAEDGSPEAGGEVSPALERPPQKAPMSPAVTWNDSPAEPNDEEDAPPPAAKIRHFAHRFDSAQGKIRSQKQEGEEWPALLDQAITLLESITRHPAMAHYHANKRKLDNLEQRLGYGAYTQ